MPSSIAPVYLHPSHLDYDRSFRTIFTVSSHTAQTETKIRTAIHILKNISHLHKVNETFHFSITSRATPGISASRYKDEAYCSAVQPMSTRHKTCTLPSSYRTPSASLLLSVSSSCHLIRLFLSIRIPINCNVSDVSW